VGSFLVGPGLEKAGSPAGGKTHAKSEKTAWRENNLSPEYPRSVLEKRSASQEAAINGEKTKAMKEEKGKR